MICPRCQEGEIKAIRFRVTGKNAFLCEACEALWFNEKNISTIKPSTIRLHSQEQDYEFSFSIDEEKEQQDVRSLPITYR